MTLRPLLNNPGRDLGHNAAGAIVRVEGPPDRLLRAVARLLTTGYAVHVVAAEVPTTVQDLAERRLITWSPHDPVAGGVAELRCAATVDDVTVDLTEAVAADAESFPTWVSGVRLEPGDVWLVGAGPGRSDLVTVGCLTAVGQADVVVTDRLVPLSVLAVTRAEAQIVDVAKIPRGRFTAQEAINAALIDAARAGHRVVRLKGGDPYVFGRGMEEAFACAAAGITTHTLSGVTSSVAVPAAAGIPVTHRGVSQSFTVVSGHVPPGDPRSTVNWAALAQAGGTLVVLMGVANAAAICAALESGGLPGRTPVAAMTDQGLAPVALTRSTVGDVAAAGLPGVHAPAVVVIGRVAGLNVDDAR